MFPIQFQNSDLEHRGEVNLSYLCNSLKQPTFFFLEICHYGIWPSLSLCILLSNFLDMKSKYSILISCICVISCHQSASWAAFLLLAHVFKKKLTSLRKEILTGQESVSQINEPKSIFGELHGEHVVMWIAPSVKYLTLILWCVINSIFYSFD